MKTLVQRIRATADKLSKMKALRPDSPKANLSRSPDELLNTSANAKGLAATNIKARETMATKPLSALIKQARKA